MSGRLSGRRAVVTGGSGGIGAAICRRFAEEGATAWAADVAKARGNGGYGHRTLDVTDERSVADLFRQVADELGGLDILVNAAGIEIEKTIEATSLDEWNRIFAVNVTGTFMTCREALPLLRKSDAASIINFGSYDGFIADPELAAYCATKGAVHALTRALACDHGPEGIRVNAICPGYVDTPMLQKFLGAEGDVEARRQSIEDIHPMRTVGTPDDIAGLAVFLASEEARYASGQLWIMDGGLTAQVQQMRI